MGRMAEVAYERQQVEQEIAIARMEAEHEAIPKTLVESLEINKALRVQVESLATILERAHSPHERNMERAIGFAIGVVASLVAALLWWTAATQLPIFFKA